MNIQDIELNKIKQMENVRLRLDEKDVHTLMNSIKQDGLLEPIGVSYIPGKKEEYYVIYGNRRLEACKKLGWNTITANILPQMELKEFLIKNSVENIERQDLTESEMGRIFYMFRNEYKMTDTEISSRFSLPVGRVKRCIDIFNMVPEKYKKQIRYMKGAVKKEGMIPAHTAGQVMFLKKRFNLTAEQMESLYEAAKEDGMQRDHIEVIGALIGQGYSIEQALKEIKEISVLHFRFPIRKKEVIRLKKKYDTNIMNVLLEILRGNFKEKVDIPSFRK